MAELATVGLRWFTRSGPDSDVVISSRVRLARNLSDHRFPGLMSAEEEAEVRQEIIEAFRRLPGSSDFAIFFLDELTPLDRRLLLERNVISQEYSVARGKAIVVSDSVSAMINEEDHLRISCIKEGMALREAFEAVNGVDDRLEDMLSFAISLEWGYVTPDLANIGTSMRASFMLHLPALVMTSLIEKALKAINQVGLSVKGFLGDGEASLGDMYQISNDATLGMNESDIVENLGSIVMPLVQYERKAREELLQRRRVDLEDRVYRALGVLTHCRAIGSREAVELLSSLRLGASLGLVKGPSLAAITELIFRSQKYHVREVLGDFEEAEEARMLDYARARLIRAGLDGTILEAKDV